jgi:hypothetical protein
MSLVDVCWKGSQYDGFIFCILGVASPRIRSDLVDVNVLWRWLMETWLFVTVPWECLVREAIALSLLQISPPFCTGGCFPSSWDGANDYVLPLADILLNTKQWWHCFICKKYRLWLMLQAFFSFLFRFANNASSSVCNVSIFFPQQQKNIFLNFSKSQKLTGAKDSSRPCSTWFLVQSDIACALCQASVWRRAFNLI